MNKPLVKMVDAIEARLETWQKEMADPNRAHLVKPGTDAETICLAIALGNAAWEAIKADAKIQGVN